MEGKNTTSIHGAIHGTIDEVKAREAEERAAKVLTDPELNRILTRRNGHETPLARQVFVNRTLNLSKVDLIGFDMDYTLAIYHLRRIEQLSYEMTVERLVTAMGYPGEVRSIPYDHAFVMRGLFIDKKQGNLLKIDRFGQVGRAYHGRKPLSEEALSRLYREERIRLKSVDYAWIDTLFALPEAALYAGIVDLYEQRLHRPVDFNKLYDDIREAIDTVHRDNSLKAIIRQDIGRYIFKDPELGPALHRLRSGGKKLFVLTNSLWDYTEVVMAYLLDGVLPEYPSWRNYFDFVITGAGKPGFFSDSRPFLEIDTAAPDNKTLGPATTLERSKIYQGGNLAGFEAMTGYQGEKVLYVGDHIYGDILKSKKTSMWRTCMVVQEIEDEMNYLEARRKEIEHLADLETMQARLDDEVGRHKTQLNQIERKLAKEPLDEPAKAAAEEDFRTVKLELDHLRRAVKDCRDIVRILDSDVERGFNPHWGLHFKEGTENSRFGEQVEQYACLYTSRVSNFLFYSPVHSFRSLRTFLPHEVASVSSKLSIMADEGLPKGSLRAPTDIP